MTTPYLSFTKKEADELEAIMIMWMAVFEDSGHHSVASSMERWIEKLQDDSGPIRYPHMLTDPFQDNEYRHEMAYSGYLADVFYDESIQQYHGHVRSSADIVTFNADDLDGALREFKISVDDYIEFSESALETDTKAI